MPKTEVRFISSNAHKISETKTILSPHGIEIIDLSVKIEELQTSDMTKLVRDKVLKAFSQIRRPLIVEHTGLELNQLGGFPGGLTQIFWDSVVKTNGPEYFCKLFGSADPGTTTARTVVGYCDGKTIELFEGVIPGRISGTPTGPRDFQWDCIFIPDSKTQTFAELGEEKNLISMRRVALEKFAAHIVTGKQ